MATLPSYVKILFQDYSQRRESALLRTEMESGPPKQAKVRSRVMLTRAAKLYLSSKADFQSFETWYRENLDEGALWFDMTDPVSGSTIEARFVGGGYTATPMSAAMQLWQVEVNIESWGS
jgi:hypothetical protein